MITTYPLEIVTICNGPRGVSLVVLGVVGNVLAVETDTVTVGVN